MAALIPDDLLADLESLQNDSSLITGDSENDSYQNSDGSERAFEYDPSLVKAEIHEEPPEEYEEDALPRHFLEGDSDENVANSQEETRSSKIKRRQRRRVHSDSEDNSEDETWTAYPSTLKKSPTKKKRRPKEGEVEAKPKRKRVSEMTPEEAEQTRAKWREERRRLRDRDKEDEAYEAKKAKWREEARLKRDRHRQRKSLPERDCRVDPTLLVKTELPDENKAQEYEDDSTVPFPEGNDDELGDEGDVAVSKKNRWQSPPNSEDDDKSWIANLQKSKQKRGSVSKRKPVSEMTPEEAEEARAKWREERKRRRERKVMTEEEREAKKKVEGDVAISKKDQPQTSNSEDDSEDDKTWTASLQKSKKKRVSVTKRKPVSEMTPEEAEEARAKWREETRRRRERQDMTEEDREAKKAKWREEARLRRQRQRELKELDGGDTSHKLKREVETKTEGEGESNLTKKAGGRKRTPISMMTEEEREAERTRVYLRNQARLAQKTPEELAEIRKRKSDYGRERNRKLCATLEEIEKRRMLSRNYYQTLPPEKKASQLDKNREAYRRRMEALRQNPEQFAKWKEDRQRRQNELKDLCLKLKEGVITKEEVAKLEMKLKHGKGATRPGETLEERLQRFMEAKHYFNRYAHARLKKTKGVVPSQRRHTMEVLLGKSRAEIQAEKETPEERTERLMRHRIAGAKRRTLKQLQAVGASPDIIERKLNEVEENCSGRPILPFKPRQSRFRAGSSDTTALELKSGAHSSTPSPRKRGPRKSKTQMPALTPAPVLSDYRTPTTSSFSAAGGGEHPGPSQSHSLLAHHHLPYAHQMGGASHQFQSSISSSYVHPYVPGSSNFHETYESSSSTSNSQLVFNASRGNYSDSTQQQQQHFTQDHSSLESFDDEPMAASPVHSYADDDDPPSPKQEPTQHRSNFGIKNQVEVEIDQWPPKPKKPRAPRGSIGSKRKWPPYVRKENPYGPRLHVAVRHPRDLMCDGCGNTYSLVTLNTHKRFCNNPHYKDHKCQICGEEFARKLDWYHKHFKVVHSEYLPQTRRTSSKKRQGEDNDQCEAKGKTHLCNQCGKVYSTSGALNKHVKVEHTEDGLLKCDFCEDKFRSKLGRDNHHYMQHGQMTHKCERCGKSFESASKLRDHWRNDHENSSHPCDFCGAVMISEIAKKLHTSQNTCKKVPKDKLLELRKIWEEEGAPSVDCTLIECEFCPGGMIRVNSLGRHYKDVHGLVEEKHKCAKCDKTFKLREFFVSHLAGIHKIPMEECLDIAKPCNVQDRKGMEVLNRGYIIRSKKGGGWKKTRPAKEKKPAGNKKERKRRSRKGTKDKDSKSLPDSDGDNQDAHLKSDDAPAADTFEPRRSSRKSAAQAQKKIQRVQKNLTREDDDDDDDSSDVGQEADDKDNDDDISNIVKQEPSDD